MNQLCRVCGEPAAGFHFGAFTCEGCKSFFGRSYNNLSSISECKNNGECVINKKNRTACKACRLRKCLLVGMSKSGSRYGRRSNWFKIHCLLQQQQQAGVGITSAGLLRSHPFLPPFRNPTTPTEAKSSESDSGASSADPEDEVRSTGALSYFRPTISPSSDRSSTSAKKLPLSPSENSFVAQKLFHPKVPQLPGYPPPVSTNGTLPLWFPTLPAVAHPSAWRDLWLQRAIPVAQPAPEQQEPIDLSVKTDVSVRSDLSAPDRHSDSDHDINIDVGVDEPVKPVPLDLTLDASGGDNNILKEGL